ncbi:MAG: hypothetical protein DESF_00790 [Desulfovibrio sp.]
MKHPLGRRRKLRPFESLSRKKRGTPLSASGNASFRIKIFMVVCLPAISC